MGGGDMVVVVVNRLVARLPVSEVGEHPPPGSDVGICCHPQAAAGMTPAVAWQWGWGWGAGGAAG